MEELVGMSELIDLLNRLLEAEKAGVETLAFFLDKESNNELYKLVKSDEAWSCAGLIQSIKREGGVISTSTGDFADKVKSLPTLPEQLALLIKGQAWVVRKIDSALALPMTQETRAFLEEMKTKHEVNISSVEQVL
jgi:hypothetical protein